MKKSKFILALSIALGLGLMQVQAAPTASFGAKADVNLSNFILTDMDKVQSPQLKDMESNIKVGASVGVFANIEFSENFALQPELLFHYKVSEIAQPGKNLDYEYMGLEIPIYAVGQMKFEKNGRAYLGIGPYIGVGINAEKDGFDLYEKIDNTDNCTMQRLDFGFGAMLGYEFDFGLQVNAGYKIGVIDALDTNKDDATMLPSTISIGLGYRF
ncbi:hypothetical protein SDC9_125883 [bioreactor metagenome]|uniref:Outer membrane protein beta-barrel domain-containing protein n=1 Tax=bioreactor metagenome TaxID=1076179 RepID=A0A645CPP0_9ZZZZ